MEGTLSDMGRNQRFIHPEIERHGSSHFTNGVSPSRTPLALGCQAYRLDETLGITGPLLDREINIHSQLHHVGCIELYAVWVEAGTCYLALEWAEQVRGEGGEACLTGRIQQSWAGKDPPAGIQP